MDKKKMFALITTALLAVTSVGVLAYSAEEGDDWWEDMKKLHVEMHGDDFETHHQAMHGDNWEEHVAGCHSGTDHEDMHTDSSRGHGMGTMMGTA